MRVLVDVFLFVPVRHSIWKKLCGIEFNDRCNEAISFQLRNQSNISADAITSSHKVVLSCPGASPTVEPRVSLTVSDCPHCLVTKRALSSLFGQTCYLISAARGLSAEP